MRLSALLGAAGLSLVTSSVLQDRADYHSLLQGEAVTPRHRGTPVSRLLEQAPGKGNATTGASGDASSEEKREQDLGVGLNPSFIAAVALVFSCLLGLMCCFVPKLEGVTLGIAGTLEERWKQSAAE
eukprot:CAMPEP_0114637758 /NCGR_PEP_ID=MMETSP0191-20121206/264_1 /TAXON_ID=126664 /ORGANISM="Sorites sp." /LENGTH=126 /DNA_ID=CAMNT_0001849493 /DNA_START=39 /DNA_END=419 /DNA_ORIENTATION=+